MRTPGWHLERVLRAAPGGPLCPGHLDVLTISGQLNLDKPCTNMITYVMLARQITFPCTFSPKLTPLLRYSCKLLVALANINPFKIKQIRTLYAKYQGWVYPARSVSGFCLSLFDFLVLCFHNLTNCFPRKLFVFTTIRVAGGVACHG